MEHDLHSLLAAARDDAPPPRLSIDDITTAGRRLARRRRRRTLLTSVAGGLAAVITGATAAIALFNPPVTAPTADPNGTPGLVVDATQSPAHPAGFTSAGPFQTNYSGYTSGRYAVSDPYLVTAHYQLSTIDLNAAPSAAPTVSPSPTVNGKPARTTSPGSIVPREGRLVVFGTGSFEPREFNGGTKLSIGGRQALLLHAAGSVSPTVADKYGCCTDPVIPAMAWQYLPGAWAAVYWSRAETMPTRDELVALAEALPAAVPAPFPVGIQVRDLPKGYRLIAAGTRTSSYDNTNLSVVRLGLKPMAPPLTGATDLDAYSSLILTLGIADHVTGEAINKTTCPPATNRCAILIEDGQFFLQAETLGDRAMSTSELSQILKTMTAEDPFDPTSWPAATAAYTS
ncbi:hypothetical protein ACQEVZ_38930 [Dactylosporangium sp. CA-152071]|uniref:hypothetical protein n=1 Tax=Dactylosporangium sp. CA-152071 TaxID=3239933 RepID=UPI003D907F23